MRAGNLNPPITIDTNADLTGATNLTMTMRRFHTTTTTTKTMTASDLTNGILTYSWTAGDTDTPGTYAIQAKATFSGKVETFPQSSYLELVILP